MESSNFFEKWYKKKIEEGNEIPPDDIWKNVSEKLDIHSVWNNISTELDHREVKKRRRVALAYVFSVAGLFLIGSWIFFNIEPSLVNSDLATNKNNKPQTNANVTAIYNGTIETSHPKKQVKQSNHIISINTSVSMTVPITSMTVPASRMMVSITNMTTPIISMTVPIITDDGQTEHNTEQNSLVKKEQITSTEDNIEIKVNAGRDYIQPINFPGIFLHFNDTNLLVRQQILFDCIEELFKPKANVARFYLGVTFGAQNPWLLNHSTYNCFSKNSINEAVPGIGICYGVSLAYYFTHNWTISGNLFIQSKYGQTYNSYNNGTYENEKINLNYKQLNLYTVKRNDTQLRNKNLVMSYGPLLGINLKHLNYANESVNGKENDIAKKYSKYDFGILLGYENSLSVKKKWLFSLSICGDMGLNNVYLGDAIEPKAFNKTRNSSLRLGFGIMYLIK